MSEPPLDNAIVTVLVVRYQGAPDRSPERDGTFREIVSLVVPLIQPPSSAIAGI